MKVDSLVSNLWIQMNYLRGFSDALQHPALATFIEETVDLLDKFEKEWPDESDGNDRVCEEDDRCGKESTSGDGRGIVLDSTEKNGVY